VLHRHTLGKLPPKPHTTFYEDGKLLMEQCLTREGFDGPFSILYFRHPPTDETAVEQVSLPGFCPVAPIGEQQLQRRHLRTQDLRLEGDWLAARRTLLMNDDIHMGISKPTAPAKDFFTNGDGDELFFVTEGCGRVESVYGWLPFKQHDYVLIPHGTPYRLHMTGDTGTLLVFEGRPELSIPRNFRNAAGQLTMSAPYTHRDFRAPGELLAYDKRLHGGPPYRLVVKMNDRLTVRLFEHFPHEVAGWDGFVYPVAFNIHDYQPKTGQIHLPPTAHTTFAGRGFVICSFVPRVVDYHARAIPCPYGHASVDCDEVLYYVEGDFSSRRGVGPESISLHPMGIPHGPHPGRYEASVGTKRTEELAVMCDTLKPLRLTAEAESIEDKDYHQSWVTGS
jgi:homogentisate 1,2-dioxygenase